ncbi:MAG: HAD family hydrolase [Pirellulales bacterium]
MRRFVLLDRDGTLNVERHYVSDPDQLELLPGAARGLASLSRMGLGLAVLTNQSAVGRGLFGQECLDRVHERLRQLLAPHGIELDGIFCCPHAPETGCRCRKPRPGLVEAAAAQLGFRPEEAFVIGDKACDIDLGRAVGATTLLVRTGYGAQAALDPAVAPDYVVDDLWEAAQVIGGIVGSEDTVQPAG